METFFFPKLLLCTSVVLTIPCIPLSSAIAAPIQEQAHLSPVGSVKQTAVALATGEPLALNTTAIAEPTPSAQPAAKAPPLPMRLAEADNEDAEPMAQVSSVSQLSDVRPTDWAFQALQSLVERYGCIVGYPDRTFRGNRAQSRYEFAAGLNACMDRINELIAAGTADLVKKEDLATLQRLQEEFAAELATLRGQVDTLDARTATLERQQFSTTTKLTGENVFGVISILGGDRADGTQADRSTVFAYRVRLNIDTSFTGRDLLRTRLQALNVTPLGGTTVNGTGLGNLRTNEGRVEFDGDSRGQVSIGLLQYRFPIGPRTNIYLAGAGN